MKYRPPNPRNMNRIGYDATGNSLAYHFDSPNGRKVMKQQAKNISFFRKYGG